MPDPEIIEAIEADQETTTDSDTENLDDKTPQQHVAFNQKNLTKIRKKLMALIDAMGNNPSWFAQAAHFWSPLPLWQKAGTGLVLVGPVLISGILLNLASLTVVSLYTLAIYVFSNILLDEHYAQEKNNTDKLKMGISELADFLGIVIESLELVSRQLTIEVERIKLVTTQLSMTEQNLSDTQIEFARIKTEMELQIEDGKKHAASLQLAVNGLNLTVNGLTQFSITDEAQRTLFIEQMTTVINSAESNFDQMAKRALEAERRLAYTQEELNRSNNRYQGLLDRQEAQVSRLESLPVPQTTPLHAPQVLISPATILSTIGLYASSSRDTSEPLPESSLHAIVVH